MSASPLTDWRYRWSHLCMVDDHWHVTRPHDDEFVHIRRWRWFRPDDLVRYVLHLSWSRRSIRCPDCMDRHSTPTAHRAASGHLTLDWGTPGNVVPPWPVLITPELLVEMIERFNETMPRDTQ